MRITHWWRDAATRQLSIIHKWPTTGNRVGRAKCIFLHSHPSARHSLQKERENWVCLKRQSCMYGSKRQQDRELHFRFQSINHSPLLNSMSIFASQGFRSWSRLSSPLADWAGISDPRAIDVYWMQLLLAASNQIAPNNRSRKHHVYAVKNVNPGRSHFTST